MSRSLANPAPANFSSVRLFCFSTNSIARWPSISSSHKYGSSSGATMVGLSSISTMQTPQYFSRSLQRRLACLDASCPMCVASMARARLRRLIGGHRLFIVRGIKLSCEGTHAELAMADATANSEYADDARVRANVGRLAAGQALTGANSA